MKEMPWFHLLVSAAFLSVRDPCSGKRDPASTGWLGADGCGGGCLGDCERIRLSIKEMS